jgi:hypothetical protein
VTANPDSDRILRQFGLGAADLIGEGSESRIYSIDAERQRADTGRRHTTGRRRGLS